MAKQDFTEYLLSRQKEWKAEQIKAQKCLENQLNSYEIGAKIHMKAASRSYKRKSQVGWLYNEECENCSGDNVEKSSKYQNDNWKINCLDYKD